MSKHKDRREYPTRVSQPVIDQGPVEFDLHLAPTIPVSPFEDLDRACRTLLAYADAHVREMIEELAATANRPLAVYLLGYIARAYDQKALNSPISESPHMERGYRKAEPVALGPRDCEWCRASFIPAHRDQRFCAPTDDREPCAVSAGLAELRHQRALRTTPKGVEAPTPRKQVVG